MNNTLQQIASEALFVQNACNPVVLANGFARALKAMRDVGMGDEEIRRSPIMTLWVSKLSSLNDWQSESSESLASALAQVEEMAQERLRNTGPRS
jgi:hypothetical protein